MKKLHNRNVSGFTLIELVIVIAILGILAAIALPKFYSLTNQARIATVNQAKGALASSAAMAKAVYISTSPPPLTITVEGTLLTYATAAVSGYPRADAAFATVSGLTASDFTITAAGTSLTISPISATTPATCRVVYTEPATATGSPTFVTTTTGC